MGQVRSALASLMLTDHDYRYPRLRVSIEDFDLSAMPAQFIQELVVTQLSAGYAKFVLKLADTTWFTLYDILGRADQSQGHLNISIEFGWPHEYVVTHGFVEHIIDTPTVEGISYTLAGVIGGKQEDIPFLKNADVRGLNFVNKPIHEIVRSIVDTCFDLPGEAIIEPTSNEPITFSASTYAMAGTNPSPHSLLTDLAIRAKPAKVTPNIDARFLDYVSRFDIDGNYHFHSRGYAQANRDPRVSYRFPYPRQNNPVISMSFSDKQWDASLAYGATVDALTGELVEADIKKAESATTRMLRVENIDEKTGDFIRRVQTIQTKLNSTYMAECSLTVMGNITIYPADYVYVEISPPEEAAKGRVIQHMTGLYLVNSVTHTVRSSFTTDLTLSQETVSGRAK